MAGTEPRMSLLKSFSALGNFAINRPRATKRGVVMLVDAGLCATTCFLSVYLRLGFFPERDTPFAAMCAISIVLALPIFTALGPIRCCT